MAPPKRRRVTQNDSDSESSSPAPAKSKRARTNNEVENDAEYDFEAEEISTQRAHLAIAKKMSQVTENIAADGGIIQAVICENFMCHRFLEINFGPFVNFVIGHNGSGKSAILTAITLCLGGKATSTNRGSAMKSFIKEGEDIARITVKLKNGGDGFKTDQYGDVITIERNFTRDGSSGYKLKSKHGRTVSSKREELDEICDYFGLQVDNPMNVLTQDLARQFLSGSTNAEKYKFFAKGVQLEQLDQDYSLIKHGIENTDAVLANKEADLAELEKSVKRKAEKMRQVENQKGLRQRIEHMQYQMAWAQVNDAEKVLDSMNEKVAALENKVQRALEARDRSAIEYGEANADYKSIKSKLDLVKGKDLAPIEDAKNQMKEKFDQNRQELQIFQADERELKGSLQQARKKIKQCTLNVKQEEERLEAINGGCNARLMEDLKAAEDDVNKAKQKIEEAETRYRDNKSQLEMADRYLRDINGRIESKKKDLQDAERHLQTLQQVDRDRMRAYDQKMPLLLQAIEKERGFRVKPVGPIGNYVTLKKQNWLSILERFFGGTLTAFVVTNHDDGELLKRVMRSVGCDFPYFITAPKELNLIEPDRKYDTIYRIIEISNEHVQRHLIIAHAIEQTVLIEDLEEANEVMRQKRNDDYIGMCFALNRERPGWGHSVGGRNGGMGVSPVKKWEQASRMRTDIAAQTRNVEADIQRMHENLEGLQRHRYEKDQEIQCLRRTVHGYDRLKRDLDVQLHRFEDKVEQLRASIEENAKDGKLGSLQEQLKSYEQKMEDLERRYEEFIINRDKINDAQQDLTNQMKGINQELILAKKRVEDFEREYTAAQRRRDQSLTDKNHYYEKVEQYERETENLRIQRDSNEAHVQGMIAQATKICERVELAEGDTAESLDARLTKLHRELERAEAVLGGTSEQITEDYTKSMEALIDARKQKDSFEELLAIETRVYNERKRRWKLFQRFISARARAQFTWMMSERAFKGRLRLEHIMKPPELIIEVQPGQEETGNRGPKTLSGGEKSFSTICLLLSLWEAMGSPIRCLDEFDVFMDPVNRNVSLNMMIKTAERSLGKQFILITPQNMSQNTSRNVKVIRMADPERNQTHINM
ncbi:Structural maintenance of chromosomes protein 6 [Rhizina undulata]